MRKDSNIIIRIDSSLKENVMKILNRNGYTLSDFVNACLLYINDNQYIPEDLNKFLPVKHISKTYSISIALIKKCVEEIIFSSDNLKEKILKVFLFGSYARGEETSKSDIDLRLETNEHTSLFDLSEFRYGLIEKLHREVEIVTRDLEEISHDFAVNVKKEEICIYEK